MARNRRNSRRNKRKAGIKEILSGVRSGLTGASKRLGPLLILACVAAGIPFAAYEGYRYTVSSPYFALKKLDVTGLVVIDNDDFFRHIQIVEGMNVFDVDVERIEILATQEPWIRSVDVERRLPDTVSIEVTEREPVAVLVDSSYLLVEADGSGFKELDAQDPVDDLLQLPLLTGPTADDVKTDEGRARIRSALAVLDEYNTMGLSELHPISEVHIDPIMGVSLVTAAQGMEIRLGEGRVTERMKRLRVVLAALNEDEIEADYVLIDHEQDLDRVIVGRKMFAGTDAGGSKGSSTVR